MNRVACVVELVMCFSSFGVWACPQVAGQEQAGEKSKSDSLYDKVEGYRTSSGCVRFELMLDGTINVLYTTEPVWLTPLGVLKILDDPRIQKELEIVDGQQADIRRAIRDIEAGIEHLESLDGTHPGIERESLAVPVTNGLNFARETLLPMQLDRVGQVFLQYELARTGLLASLAGGTLDEQLKVSIEQWNRLRDHHQSQLKEAAPKILQWKERVREELAGCLEEPQREKLKQLLINDALLVNPPLSLMISQLDRRYVDELNDQLDKMDNPFPDYASFLIPESDRRDINGGWKQQVVSGNPASRIPGELLGILKDPAAVKLFELSDSQLATLEELRASRRLLQEQVMADHNAGKYKSWAESNREGNRRFAEFGKAQLPLIEAVLLPHQHELLTKMRRHFGCHRAGLYYMLVHGELRELLDVSDDRIDKIHQTAKCLHEELGEELCALERDLNRQLIERLHPEQREKLARLTGDSLELERGQIEIDSVILSEHQYARHYARTMKRVFHSLPEILGPRK